MAPSATCWLLANHAFNSGSIWQKRLSLRIVLFDNLPSVLEGILAGGADQVGHHRTCNVPQNAYCFAFYRSWQDLAGSTPSGMEVENGEKVTKNVGCTSAWALSQRHGRKSSNAAPQLLLTAVEAARVLSISPRTLWTLTKSGDNPVIQVGSRSIRYSVDDLKAWIGRKRQGGVGAPETDQVPQGQNGVRA
jgi:predicted DNA-binding transcriptional regulator AlpA